MASGTLHPTSARSPADCCQPFQFIHRSVSWFGTISGDKHVMTVERSTVVIRHLWVDQSEYMTQCTSAAAVLLLAQSLDSMYSTFYYRHCSQLFAPCQFSPIFRHAEDLCRGSCLTKEGNDIVHTDSLSLSAYRSDLTRDHAGLCSTSSQGGRPTTRMQRSSLKHTHLLGRHLVLKWADEAEQNLDVCRVQRGEEMPERKRKLNISEGRGGGRGIRSCQ